MKRVSLLILLTLTNLSAYVYGQTNTTVYAGHIQGPQGEAIDYATVILLRNGDQIAGGVTDSIGDFALKVDTGAYTLIIQCIGFEPIRKSIRISTDTHEKFVLQTSAYALKEVVVQARNIERKADRFVINVSPTSGKDGTELLTQAPGIWLADDNISINGASGTKVFVDNREIKLSGEELLSYLRSLKSEDIRQIEVIPIAGAEYDANMRGGIIRITLRRRLDNGVQGNVAIGTVLAPSLTRYLPSASIYARIGKWSVNAAASGIFTPDNKSKMGSEKRYPQEDVRFSSLSGFDIRSGYGTGRLGAIFEIDTVNSVGGEIEYIRQTAKGPSWSRTDLTKGGFIMNSNGKYGQTSQYQTVAATINYLRKIDNRGSALKLIVDYANKKSEGDNDYNVTQETEMLKHDSLYRSHADATYEIVTTDLSGMKYFSKKLSLNAGVKYTHTSMDDYSRYDGLTLRQEWEENPAYGYILKYKENIMGAYASFSAEAGKWSLIAGLRGEYTRTDYRSDHIERDYFDLFPNLSATYAFDRMKRWLLVGQYARNVERPTFYTLNPNRLQTSDFSYQIGNPYLRPTYINRFSATLVYNYRYTLTVGGNLHHDLIREFCKQDKENPDISYITYENHHSENHWFVAINLPMQPTAWCNLTANFVGVRQDIRMTEEAAFKAHYLAFVNANATFLLPADFTAEVQYSGTSRLYSGNSEVDPRHTINLSVRKKFADNRFLLTASANNIFDRQQSFVSRIDAYTTYSRYESALSGRTFKVSLTWNFNSEKKVKKSKIERSSTDERSRLNEK
ncbi:outer membrane beta-barrel family protein [uncultured Parabacteroides sp.]|uniref:outer membrane beta-barrel family protein n=1 Tax=uncultured Parabacteroides sp. TaxID=512312 RepID=UPI00265F3F00|nr:outer membrane beta-barrel family protein [uncultured Parabacteroides sp.]